MYESQLMEKAKIFSCGKMEVLFELSSPLNTIFLVDDDPYNIRLDNSLAKKVCMNIWTKYITHAKPSIQLCKIKRPEGVQALGVCTKCNTSYGC